MRFILGSQSPRRYELMSGLDIPFTVVNIDADESYPVALRADEIPVYISKRKAEAYMSRLKEDELLITADTIVWINGQELSDVSASPVDMVLGKPKDAADAARMLRILSGHTHQVYTAVTFARLGSEMDTVYDCTDVTFKRLTDEEIDYYVSHYRPFDKAGAYGVQEWIGYIGVTRMVGSYFNVMGFPIDKVYSYLKTLL